MSRAERLLASNPLVSIVIPVYNGANFVASAIDSALAQTWSHVEVVVVDDGSDDEGATARICAGYGDRIRYFHKANGGVATALNLGIQMMRGEFFSWLSHDDLYLPDRLEMMLQAYARFAGDGDDTPIVHSDFEYVDADGERVVVARRAIHPDVDRVMENAVHGCTLLIPRGCFDRAGLFHPGLPTTQDSDLWQRMLRVTRIERSPAVTIESRVHDEQGSRAWWHVQEVASNRLAFLDRVDSGFFRHARVARRELYRRLILRHRFGMMSGVHRDAALRLARSLRTQSVELIWTGPGRRFSGGLLPLAWRRGVRLSVRRMGEVEPAAVISACGASGADLVWLWDGPLDTPVQMLERTRDQVVLPSEASSGSAAGALLAFPEAWDLTLPNSRFTVSPSRSEIPHAPRVVVAHPSNCFSAT